MKGCDNTSPKKIPLLLMMLGQIHSKSKILISKILRLLNMFKGGWAPIVVDMSRHSFLNIQKFRSNKQWLA